jgi:hypothetical protein
MVEVGLRCCSRLQPSHHQLVEMILVLQILHDREDAIKAFVWEETEK